MNKKYKILIHFVFWVYMFNQSLYPFFINHYDKYFWKDTFITLGLNIINFYLIYLLLPSLIKYRNKLVSILTGVALLFVMAVFRYFVESVYWKDILHTPANDLLARNAWLYMNFRVSLITGVYAVLIKFSIDWFETQKLKAELINQTQASELALLRSQVNPHFLFNTLNNIYSLVYKKSVDAPAAVMKLSSIMRYMLYDATTDQVALEKEIEYLQSFIELQRLRLKEPDFVLLDITGDVNCHTIAPMLLIPFVENAFKHGSKNVSNPGILINLNIEQDRVCFQVFNYQKNNTIVHKDRAGGIGLQNINRRLKLLYPEKHTLEIREDKDTYSIKLILEN
jgi:two-component system, LytTR family, sensor kinase